jgi:hypothetical protein
MLGPIGREVFGAAQTILVGVEITSIALYQC